MAKTLWDGAKIMMAVSRKAKKKGRLLYMQVVSHKIYGEIVYICDGCCIFPIEKAVFDANAVKYGFDKANTNQDLYKLLRDAYDSGSNAAITPITYDNNADLTTRIIRIDKGYVMVDVTYSDLINFLPKVLQDCGAVKVKDDKSPIANYKESCDLGYCVLPIYNIRGADNKFEKTITDLSCVCDWN